MSAPKNFPEMWAALLRELRTMRQAMNHLLDNSGIHLTGPKAFDIDGDVNVTGLMKGSGFDGDLDAGDAGTTGWAMDGDRAAFGELILRPGSIGNDSLTDPVKTEVYRAQASNFALTAATLQEKCGVNVTVPPGFTQAQVSGVARLYAANPNSTGGADGTGTDALYVQVEIAGQTSAATPTGVSGSGGFATTVSFDAFVLTGLTPGSTIRVAANGASAVANIAASGQNYVNVVATITWLR